MKNFKFLPVSYLIFLILSQLIFAQNPQWLVYNISNSPLPSNYVVSITSDNNHNFWIDTYPQNNGSSGLVKFNGIDWTKYSQGNFLSGFSAVMGFAIDNWQDNWVTAVGDSIITMARFNDTTWTLFGDSTIGFHLPVTFGGIAIDSKISLNS